MSIVPSCELDRTKLTEEYILNMEAFLNIYPLTAFEAQLILETSQYPSHHVDIRTLEKRMPKEFNVATNNLESTAKYLIQWGYLEAYTGKKEVLCIRCSKLGRDVARQIITSCFSASLRFFEEEKNKIDRMKRRLCYDPLGLEVDEKRYAKGPNGRIMIVISKLLCSDTEFATSESRVEYERKVVAEVECPQCHNLIHIQYSFNPATVWQKYLDIECEKCSFLFSLAYSLMGYYETTSE